MNEQKPSPETPQTEKKPATPDTLPKEIGGFEDADLKEPTRYGDWDVKGRCSDF